MRTSSTVKSREVVTRDAELPKKQGVDMTLERTAEEHWFTDAEWRSIQEGEADIAAGRVYPADEVVARLRRAQELRRQVREQGRTRRRPRGGEVGTPGPRTKPAAGRGRGSK